jgi:hypothetical protein
MEGWFMVFVYLLGSFTIRKPDKNILCVLLALTMKDTAINHRMV